MLVICARDVQRRQGCRQRRRRKTMMLKKAMLMPMLQMTVMHVRTANPRMVATAMDLRRNRKIRMMKM
jgi:hypothetical protein